MTITDKHNCMHKFFYSCRFIQPIFHKCLEPRWKLVLMEISVIIFYIFYIYIFLFQSKGLFFQFQVPEFVVSVFSFSTSPVRVEHTTSHSLLLYNSANSNIIKTFKIQLYLLINIFKSP